MFVVLREMERGAELPPPSLPQGISAVGEQSLMLQLTSQPHGRLRDARGVKEPSTRLSPRSVQRDDEEVHRVSIFIDVLTECMNATTHQFSLWRAPWSRSCCCCARPCPQTINPTIPETVAPSCRRGVC